MAIKTTGAEWNKFYNDPEFWPDNVYHDDTTILVNGEPCDDVDRLSDESKVVIEEGYVVLGDVPSEGDPSLESYFKRWRKKQSHCYVVVECKKELRQKIVDAVTAAGGKCKN